VTDSRGDLFRQRFSCRSFTAGPVPRATIEALLDAARWAPSGGNLQPWRFVVVTAEHRRRELASAALGQGFVAQAPVVIVVCAVPEESARQYGDRGRELYALQDTAAATENLLLAATHAGLGACWVGAFDEHRVRRVLGLEPGWRPVALVPVGRPAEAPGRRSRRPLGEVVGWVDD
jgi:nitroreductase